jgi:membrane protein YdbS with pleckstrin-like domain
MEHLNPKVLILFFVKNFLGTFYVVPIWFIGVGVFDNIWTSTHLPMEPIIYILYGAGIIFLIFLMVASYYWAWLTFANFSYELQADGLHINRGVIIKRQIIIPPGQIQNVIVYVNPIVMRLLGLYSVHIMTREDTEKLLGLTPEMAQHLRTELIKLSHIQPIKKTYFDPVSGKFR